MLAVWLVLSELTIIGLGGFTAVGILRSQTGYQGRHRLSYEGRHRND
jgi:hypothetical protein